MRSPGSDSRPLQNFALNGTIGESIRVLVPPEENAELLQEQGFPPSYQEVGK